MKRAQVEVYIEFVHHCPNCNRRNNDWFKSNNKMHTAFFDGEWGLYQTKMDDDDVDHEYHCSCCGESYLIDEVEW